MRKSTILFSTLTLLSVSSILAQGIPLNSWREHLPYLETNAVTASNNKVYCAARSSVFYFDESDNTLNRLNTITGLSDVEISTIGYNEKTNTLIIAYLNGNIDLLTDEGEIINVSFIKKSDIVGDKTIYRINMVDEFAYLSCGFGIVVFDTKKGKREIKDTYFVGNSNVTFMVLDVLVTPDTIFAATEAGLYTGLRSKNLADYSNWTLDKGLPAKRFSEIEQLGDKFIVNYQTPLDQDDTVYTRTNGKWELVGILGDTAGTVRNYDFAVYDNELIVCQDYNLWRFDAGLNVVEKIFTYNNITGVQPRQAIRRKGYYWVADNANGLAKVGDNYRVELMRLMSPETERTFDIDIQKGNLWYAAGGFTKNFTNLYYWPIMGHFNKELWSTVSRNTQTGLDTIYDLVSIAVDPNDTGHVFAGSWGTGLVELQNGKLTAFYGVHNRSTHTLSPRADDNKLFVGGLDFDQNGNLWMSNSYNTRLLSVLTPGGEWMSYNFGSKADINGSVATVMADSYNNVWLLQHRDDKLLVYNHGGTPLDLTDDPVPAVLSNSEGSGNLPGDYVFCIAEDLNGEIWLGTNHGIAVIYNPSAIFNGGNYDAQQILIQQDGTTQILFEMESITVIAVDGANRKWVGTENAGVFLMSADGTEQIYHFSTDNSPLFSNNIKTIAIDHLSGEVYIGTDKGLISYKGSATAPEDEISDVTVYPNPVHRDYHGLIAIRGLTERSVVKITDVNGGLVYETESLGGQAVWNGKNFNGERVATGVYLIFSAGKDGEQTNVSKVMVLN